MEDSCMTEAQQIQLLARITREENLREILMGLFEKMQLEPELTHGPLEQGKDIVCHEENCFGLSEWISAVVKVGRITGTTSGPASLQTVINQVQESFVHPYKPQTGKESIRINKVLVVTNAEISATAREKLFEKLLSLGHHSPNVHFLEGRTLVRLLNTHWKEYWKERRDVLASTDRMSREVGLVLYVLARAYELSRPGAKKKIGPNLSLSEIIKQTWLRQEIVEVALTYLIQTQYVQEVSDAVYTLDHKLTRGRPLTNINEIRFLLEIKRIANGNLHFTRKHANEIAKKKPLNFKPKFVKKALGDLTKGDYIQADQTRGEGHLTFNRNMLGDEWEYLQCWLTFKTELPSKPESQE